MDRAVNQGPWLQERVGGGVGRDGANFATCGRDEKKKKRVPTGAGLVDRAVNQRPWLQERVGGGVGADGSWGGLLRPPRLGGVQGLRCRGGRW